MERTTERTDENSVNNVNRAFEQVLEESAQAAKHGMGVLETWTPDSTDGANGANEPIQTKSGRLSHLRQRDAQDARRRELFGGCVLSSKVRDSRLVQALVSGTVSRPRWALVGLVMLKSGGVCGVCGEQVKMDMQVRLVDPVCRGGEWVEENLIGVCKYCAECWYPHKTFNRGLGLKATLQTLSVAVMRRRQGEFRGVKRLDKDANERYKVMLKDELGLVDRLKEQLETKLRTDLQTDL